MGCRIGFRYQVLEKWHRQEVSHDNMGELQSTHIANENSFTLYFSVPHAIRVFSLEIASTCPHHTPFKALAKLSVELILCTRMSLSPRVFEDENVKGGVEYVQGGVRCVKVRTYVQ